MHGATHEPIIRNEVWDMSNGTCLKCNCRLSPAKGRSSSMHVDHIVPKSRGGIDHLSNYQPLCAKCNMSKGNSSRKDLRSAAVQAQYPAPRMTPATKPAEPDMVQRAVTGTAKQAAKAGRAAADAYSQHSASKQARQADKQARQADKQARKADKQAAKLAAKLASMGYTTVDGVTAIDVNIPAPR